MLNVSSPLPFFVEHELPRVVAVGEGSVIDVRLRLPEKMRGAATVSLEGETVALSRHREATSLTIAGQAARIHSALVPVRSRDKPVSAELLLTCSGGTARIGRIFLTPSAWTEPPGDFHSADGSSKGDLVVVCMATYEPDPALLTRQVQSILNQTYPNLSLIICDDASTFDVGGFISENFGDDGRIKVYRNDRNLGYYHNFERALSLVPGEAEYVALADQDDFWYPDKLEKSIGRFGAQTDLVFCDAVIRLADGSLLAETYWTERRPYCGPLDALLTLNTVTGAAAVFRRSLLDVALPFPPNLGGAFHDHWLACCAAAGGGIEFIDLPLYDYIQHGRNVTGHVQTKHAGVLQGQAQALMLTIGGRFTRYLAAKEGLYRSQMELVFWNWFRQLQIYQSCLELRRGFPGDQVRQAHAMFAESSPEQALKDAHRRYRSMRTDTNNVEVLFLRANRVAGCEGG